MSVRAGGRCRTHFSPRSRGVLFVLKGPYDPRAPLIVKFCQESESERHPVQKYRKSPLNTSTARIANRVNIAYEVIVC